MSQLRHLIESFSGIQPVMAVFWLGLIIFTACLAVLMYTRWGQYRPLRKCMGLSLLAHLVLACYAATIHIAAPIRPEADTIRVSIGDGPVEKRAGWRGIADFERKRTTVGSVSRRGYSATESGAFERRETGLLVEPTRLVRTEDNRLPGDPAIGGMALTEVKPLMPIVASARPADALAGQTGRIDRCAGGPTL